MAQDFWKEVRMWKTMNDCPIALKCDENVGKVSTLVGKMSSFRHQNDCRRDEYGQRSGEQRFYQQILIWFSTKTVHKAILVYQFLAEKQIQMLKPVPYSRQILLHATFFFSQN